MSDPLSQVFDLIEIKGLMSSGFTAPRGRAWVARGSLARRLKFIAVVRGHARLTASGTDRPLDLEPGDVALLNDQAWLEVRGG